MKVILKNLGVGEAWSHPGTPIFERKLKKEN
jgi:hypothetical protein